MLCDTLMLCKGGNFMKLRKLFIGAVLAVSFMGVSVNANAKTKVATIKVTKKSQVSSASRKAWSNYKKSKPYKVTGKYSTSVKKYVKKQIMLSNGIRWCNTPVTSSKASLMKGKSEARYLGLIIKDLNDIYNKAISRYDTATNVNRFTKEEYKVYEGIAYSEIKGLVMGTYFDNTMDYEISEDMYFTGDYEKVYKSTYKGDCGGSAHVVMNIAKAWGLKTRYFRDAKEHHAWACIKSEDVKGTVYWQGVGGSSGARSMSLDGKSELKCDKTLTPHGVYLDPETEEYVYQLTASHK